MFLEVEISDGMGEFMVHLDENNNPIRIYTYNDVPNITPDNRRYYVKCAETDLYCVENYKQLSPNTLFLDYVGDLKKAWKYLKKFT